MGHKRKKEKHVPKHAVKREFFGPVGAVAVVAAKEHFTLFVVRRVVEVGGGQRVFQPRAVPGICGNGVGRVG